MVPNIDPKVDIAFKKVFGTPEWCQLTISLINAVLQPEQGRRAVELELLNPYSEKVSPDDKLTILDIRARDERGRLFNVEMQMNLVPSLAQRLLFYWSQLYSRQLSEGEDYAKLCPTISICFLNQTMFRDRAGFHRVFRLLDRDLGSCLTEDLEIHLLEMPKFSREMNLLKEPLDFWLYFFKNGQKLDADALPTSLATPDISKAMEVLKVYSQSDLERERYEDRVKGLRDHRAFVHARDEAVQERDEAVQERDEAVQERDDVVQERDDAVYARDDAVYARDDAVHARDDAVQRLEQAEHMAQQVEHVAQQAEQRLTECLTEAELEINRELLKRIQLCRRLLGHHQTDSDQLLHQPVDDLRTLAECLEQQLPSE